LCTLSLIRSTWPGLLIYPSLWLQSRECGQRWRRNGGRRLARCRPLVRAAWTSAATLSSPVGHEQRSRRRRQPMSSASATHVLLGSADGQGAGVTCTPHGWRTVVACRLLQVIEAARSKSKDALHCSLVPAWHHWLRLLALTAVTAAPCTRPRTRPLLRLLAFSPSRTRSSTSRTNAGSLRCSRSWPTPYATCPMPAVIRTIPRRAAEADERRRCM
jgi:hypothetical protein